MQQSCIVFNGLRGALLNGCNFSRRRWTVPNFSWGTRRVNTRGLHFFKNFRRASVVDKKKILSRCENSTLFLWCIHRFFIVEFDKRNIIGELPRFFLMHTTCIQTPQTTSIVNPTLVYGTKNIISETLRMTREFHRLIHLVLPIVP